MNKTLITILSLFLLSVGLVWYSAKQQVAKRLPASASALVVGTNAEYRPFAFKEGDKMVGFDIDLIHALEKELRKNITIVDRPWTALISDIQLGSIDMTIGGVTPTAERAKSMIFTEPYLSERPLVIVTRTNDPTLATVDELLDKKVIVNEGFTSDTYMSQFEGPELLRLDTLTDAFLALEAGKADALVADQDSSNALIAFRDPSAFKVVTIPNVTENFAIAITKDRPAILTAVQKALDTLKRNGTIQQLREKWNVL